MGLVKKRLYEYIRNSGAIQYCSIVARKAHVDAENLIKSKLEAKENQEEIRRLLDYLDWR